MAKRPKKQLNSEQLQIVNLLVNGYDRSVIVRMLALTRANLQYRLASLRRRLGAGNDAEIVARWQELEKSEATNWSPEV